MGHQGRTTAILINTLPHTLQTVTEAQQNFSQPNQGQRSNTGEPVLHLLTADFEVAL